MSKHEGVLRPVALVTGSASPIGRAIARELAKSGFDLVLHAHRSANKLDADREALTAAGARCVVLTADLEEAGSAADLVARSVDAMGVPSLLVNNVGIYEPDLNPGESAKAGSWSEESRRDHDGCREILSENDKNIFLMDFEAGIWERHFRLNCLTGVTLACEAAKRMKSAGGGRIVQMIDALTERPRPSYGAYYASKAALAAATRYHARVFAPWVQVNGVAPGWIDTSASLGEEASARLTARIPAGRAGTAEEVAQVVGFLSRAPAYMTGQILALDGGRSLV